MFPKSMYIMDCRQPSTSRYVGALLVYMVSNYTLNYIKIVGDFKCRNWKVRKVILRVDVLNLRAFPGVQAAD